jgi:2-oxoisovalerate dehydrogenase E1 component
MGGGRGYGPTHSQSLEKHLAGVPGTQLFLLHRRTHVQRFYQDLLFQLDTPSIVIENKSLYAKSANQQWPLNYQLLESKEKFPVSVLRLPEEADITLVAFGGASDLAEQAAVHLYKEEEIVAELIYPLQVYPLDVSVILESLRRTKRLVVVEEGACGFDLGAEVIASISERWKETESFRVARLGAKEIALPSALSLEREVLPTLSALLQLCLETYGD